MRTAEIDFHYVDAKHKDIHKRLQDWAYWVKPRGFAARSPMFLQYRPDGGYVDVSPRKDINTLDCSEIEKAVAKLPEKHGDSLRWCYVFCTTPIRACRAIGVTPRELFALIHDGRQMLINRRV